MEKEKSLLKLSNKELDEFFFKNNTYCNLNLPSYIDFESMLKELYEILKDKDINSLLIGEFKGIEDTNYKIISNKNGKYSWRPIELINPILYSYLCIVIKKNFKEIKKRFDYFKGTKNIECFSIPMINIKTYENKTKYQILNWWKDIEQKSIEFSLEYNYLYTTDISDCYGSMYTHSIPWALHGKEKAKANRRDLKLIGNKIDNIIQAMSYGQTNGIPQGSVLMDFIAEIVLGYADTLLYEKIKNIDYKILRYRDDYRIFTNNERDAEIILKELTIVLQELGMKLNSEKTISSDDIINLSIKKDKLDTFLLDFSKLNLQKQLLVIKKEVADKHPNSGTLSKCLDIYLKNLDKVINIEKDINEIPYLKKDAKELNKTQKKINKFKYLSENILILISVSTDIALKNPKIYPQYVSILSRLFTISNLTQNKKKNILSSIKNKFDSIPNVEYLNLWLQWLKGFDIKEGNNKLCEYLNKNDGKLTDIWKFPDIKDKKIKLFIENTTNTIKDKDKFDNRKDIIGRNEVSIFNDY